MLRVKKCRLIEMHVCTVYTGTHERIPKYAVVYQAAYVVTIPFLRSLLFFHLN